MNAFTRQVAAANGRRAGRSGLTVEEVADTAYLIRLRRDAVNDLTAIAVALDRDLDEQRPSDLLPARRNALIRRARAAAELRIADYELLCAAYGQGWRCHHRDRAFVDLGWRCPRLTAGVEVGGHVFR